MRKKNRHKIIIGIEVMVLSITVSLLGTNAASSNPPSNGVSYNKNGQVTVENALDNLYSKANYGNATANDILKGKKALVGGKEVVGTFTCPTLASLTPGDAKPENITDGKIAWVNGKRIVGTYGLLADKVKLGDYISYTPSSTSQLVSAGFGVLKIDSNANVIGINYENVTINPSELKIWQVLNIRYDGTVEIVSCYSSSKTLTTNLDETYHEYIEKLNDMAALYETPGITVGSRHLGYDKMKAMERTPGRDMPDNGYLMDWNLLKEAGISKGVMNIGNFNDSYYFLASRKSDSVYCVGRGGELTINCDSFSGTGKYQYTSGNIRPVVYLKATLKIAGGDGSQSSPYTLEI